MLENKKISKSRNWYISLRDFLRLYPADYLRFYMASITPYSQEDLNFDWYDFASKINNELIDNIGNFVNRVLSFTNKRFDSRVPEPREFDDLDNSIIENMKSIGEGVGSLIFKNEIDKGLKRILAFSNTLNQYFQAKMPWSDQSKAKNCLYISVNSVRVLAILLAPYIPFSSQRIWEQLGLEGLVSRERWDAISLLAIEPDHKIGRAEPLFKKIDKEGIDKQKSNLGLKG